MEKLLKEIKKRMVDAKFIDYPFVLKANETLGFLDVFGEANTFEGKKRTSFLKNGIGDEDDVIDFNDLNDATNGYFSEMLESAKEKLEKNVKEVIEKYDENTDNEDVILDHLEEYEKMFVKLENIHSKLNGIQRFKENPAIVGLSVETKEEKINYFNIKSFGGDFEEATNLHLELLISKYKKEVVKILEESNFFSQDEIKQYVKHIY